MEQNYGPNRQVVLLLVSLFFLLLYVIHPFKNEDYNNLCLAFAIFNFAWLGTVVVRYVYYYQGGKYRNESALIPIPDAIKCYFGEPNCEKGDFTIFSIFHFVGYLLVGLFIPGYYLEILVISVAGELFEVGIGYTAKFFLDPTVNMLGYLTGSLLSWNKKSDDSS